MNRQFIHEEGKAEHIHNMINLMKCDVIEVEIIILFIYYFNYFFI